jgi:hypothetical protein
MAEPLLKRRSILSASLLLGTNAALSQPLPSGPVGASPSAAAAPNVAVENIAILKALTARPSVVIMAGRSIPGDGGGGIFWWDAGSQSAPDDALVVSPSAGPSGRYRRLFSGTIDVGWFGADIQAAIDAARASNATVQASRITEISSTVVLRSGVNLLFSSGAKFLWKGPRAGTCVETDRSDVVRNATWTGLTIDTGPDFAGTALYMHSAHNIGRTQ